MIELNDTILRDKTFGSLISVFVGDAMGLPVESFSPANIRTLFGYIDKMVTNRHRPHKSISSCPIGTISDDSQLTLALMSSLAKGYNLNDIKNAHVAAWQGKWGRPVGWGGSTKSAVQDMLDNTWKPRPFNSAGNGTCMKIAPLAIFCVYRCRTTPHKRFTNSFNASLFKKCREITELTHGDPRCIVATYCQARMVIRAIQNEIPLEPDKIADMFISDAKYAESKLNVLWPQDGLLSDRLKWILKTRFSLKFDPDIAASPEDVKISNFDLDTARVSVSICSCQSSYIMNSYPLVAYCVCKYFGYRNFMKAVTETVNAGADADSNGSMTGSIIGGHLGQRNIPISIFRQVKNHTVLLKEVEQFWRAIK